MAGSHTLYYQEKITRILIAETKPDSASIDTFRLHSLMDAVCQRKNWCEWEIRKEAMLS